MPNTVHTPAQENLATKIGRQGADISKATTDKVGEIGKATHDMLSGGAQEVVDIKNDPKTLGARLNETTAATTAATAAAKDKAGAAVTEKAQKARSHDGEVMKPSGAAVMEKAQAARAEAGDAMKP